MPAPGDIKSSGRGVGVALLGNRKLAGKSYVSICKIINQESINWAEKNAGARSLARYKQLGTPIVLGEDKGPYNVGPLWIWTPLSMKKVKDASGREVLEVRSVMMHTPIDYSIAAAAGMHYCKLLSPARVTEWMYVDGLRASMSL